MAKKADAKAVASTASDADKAKKKSEREAKERVAQERLVKIVIAQAKNKDEESRKELLSLSTTRLPKTTLDELIASGDIKQNYADWLLKETEIFKAGKRTGGGGAKREKVDRPYPAKFVKYDKAAGDRCTEPNAKMIEAGTEFNTNLKVFIDENQELLDTFELNGEYWSTYFRTDEPLTAEELKKRKAKTA